MSFKKNIEPENVLISSFKVHKTFTFNTDDSGSGFFSVPIKRVTDSSLWDFGTATAETKVVSSSTYYKVPTYHEINNLYYKDIRTIRGYVDYIRGVPTSSNAIISYNSETQLRNTKLPLRTAYTRQLHETGTVISIPQKFFGETIKPHSVRVTDDSTSSTIILQDDGYGNLYDVAYSSSYARREPDASNNGALVGNIFYNDGLLVITDTGSYSDVATKSGSDGFSVRFDSTQTIHEREYVCVADENEFQYTNNRSLKVGRSGSVSVGSFITSSRTNTIHDGYPYGLIGYSTSSWDTNGYNIGTELLGVATHSEFSTYVSSIGLYNDANELLAVAKPAKPIKNEKELALTFVVRFDTN